MSPCLPRWSSVTAVIIQLDDVRSDSALVLGIAVASARTAGNKASTWQVSSNEEILLNL